MSDLGTASEDTQPAVDGAGDARFEQRPGTTVVVGAARGIGAGIAERLARASWTERIVLADIDGESADEVAAQIRSTGVSAEGRRVDVTAGDQVAALMQATADARRVAIVAGVFEPSPAIELTEQSFRRIVDVNLFGAFFVAQAYAKAMAENGGGSIVGVASIAARMPRMRQAAYCASKAGMRQALRVLGMEVAEHEVRINTVSPGATDTPMMRSLAGDHPSVDHLAEGSSEAMRPRIPDGRVATPADVAEAVAFLLSPQGSHVVLQDVVIDGGELLGM
jgi:2,3-dihydro-2,3-dihydroxybenzoate dehydrogenase